MFRELRRKGQGLDRAACEEILRTGDTGVLAVLGDGGYPYAVPLNYVYDGGMLYFHCAKAGHKLDAIGSCDRVSFCVVGRDQVVPQLLATDYRSVVAFGRVRVLEGEDCRRSLERLAEKYAPEHRENNAREIEKTISAVCVLAVTVEHLSGKCASRDVIQSVQEA